MCVSTIERQSLNGFVVLIVRLCLFGVFGDTILPNTQRLFFQKPTPVRRMGGGGLPNLLNDFFERRFQVIKSSVHCFVFGFSLPDHSADVQRANKGLGKIILSNFDPAVGLCPRGGV